MKKVLQISKEVPLDSPRRAMLKVVRDVLSPTLDPDVAAAIQKKRGKRKRVQAEAGEVLTETAVERLRQEADAREASKKTQSKGKGKGKNSRVATTSASNGTEPLANSTNIAEATTSTSAETPPPTNGSSGAEDKGDGGAQLSSSQQQLPIGADTTLADINKRSKETKAKTRRNLSLKFRNLKKKGLDLRNQNQPQPSVQIEENVESLQEETAPEPLIAALRFVKDDFLFAARTVEDFDAVASRFLE